MSCRKVFIQIHDINRPSLQDSEGRIGFFIPEGLEINYNRTATELTDLDSLVANYTNTFTIETDSHIREVFCHAEYTRGRGNVKKYRATLLVDRLQFIDGIAYVSETSTNICGETTEYSILILDEIANFKEELKACDLCDLDFGTTNWDKTTILDLAQNNQLYTPTNGYPPIYPSLANLGKWIREDDSSVPKSDRAILSASLIPSIYVTAILEKAFCKAGYKLKSNFFQSVEYGRKLAILAADYSRKDLLDTMMFSASMDANLINVYNVNGTLPTPQPSVQLTFNTEDDPNNLFNLFAGNDHSGGSYYGKLIFSGGVGFAPQNLTSFNAIIIFEIIKDFGTVNQEQLGEFEVDLAAWDAAGQPIVDVFVITENILVVPTSSYTVRARIKPIVFSVYNINIFPDNGWTFKNEVTAIPLVSNPNISDGLTCVSVYKILTDLFKIYGLKLMISKAEGTVMIEPANDYTTWDGVRHKGFYEVEIIDITDCIDLSKSITKAIDLVSDNRYCEYKFKEDNKDNYPTLTDDIYSSTIDKLTGKEETTEITTTVFAPTAMDLDTLSYVTNPNNSSVFLPHIWSEAPDNENEVPERIWSFAPRLVYVFGWLRMFVGSTNPSAWNFEGTELTEFPIVAPYFSPYPVQDPNTLLVFGVEENTVFDAPDHEGVTDIFIRNNREGIPLKVTGELSLSKSLCLSPNKKVKIDLDERFSGCYILSSFATNLNGCGEAEFELIEETETKC